MDNLKEGRECDHSTCLDASATMGVTREPSSTLINCDCIDHLKIKPHNVVSTIDGVTVVAPYFPDLTENKQ